MFHQIYKLLKYILAIILTLPRDIGCATLLLRLKKKAGHYDETQECVADVFMKLVKKQPNKPCIIFNDKVWTFQDLENYGNKIANLFAERFRLKKGDVVALMMENKPEFPGIWYGLSKLGVITACINTNLKAKALVHSIEVALPKLVIYDEELEASLMDVKDSFTLKLDFIRQGTTKEPLAAAKNFPRLEDLLADQSDVFAMTEKVANKDILMYIYTSGTTGLPKPAIIKHGRYIAGGFTFYEVAGFTDKDTFLVTLPVYHSNAGVIGLGSALICGATVVLCKKFSASNFFKVAIKHNVTGFSFVGEICRYLLNQPVSDLDRKHSIRACVGNGMRGADLHRQFTERFGIKCVELYGATEGNAVLVNVNGKYGACGFIPLLNDFITLMPTYIIRVDRDYNPVRDAQGRCIKCEADEKGLLVGVIGNNTKEGYSGYANQTKEQSEKKVIPDLFKPGQNAFNTGDLLVRDWLGYTYFVDRLGDTFRWRGENVSTFEVENIISARLSSKEVIVYGVEVPGQEGRAGMATICDLNVNMVELGENIKKDLTSYAKPLFIRLEAEVEHTGSFKAQKNRLTAEAYDISKFKSKTFYFDSKEQAYKELTLDVYNQIQSGSIRL